MLVPLLLLATLTCVIALLVAEQRDRGRLALAAKTCASLCFVLLGGIAAEPGAAFDRFLLVGLVCAALGDVCLALPGERAFLAGTGAFWLGHAAYVAAAHQALGSAPLPAWAFLISIPSLAAYRWLYPALGPMRVAVAAYVGIITLLVVYAIALYTARPDVALEFMLGALLFYASDLSVARDRFVQPAWVNKLWGLPTYYAGQLLLAHSVAQL